MFLKKKGWNDQPTYVPKRLSSSVGRRGQQFFELETVACAVERDPAYVTILKKGFS